MRLILDEEGETGLWADARCGFWMAMPGTPYQAPPLEAPQVPRHDARIMIKDVPVELRLRLDGRPEGLEAAPLALGLAEAFARNRTRGEVSVVPSREEQRRGWGVEAAASALYALARFDPSGADAEEVLVLVKAPWVMTMTRSFPGAFTDSLRWTLFASASGGSLCWDAGRPAPATPPALWPESGFLRPGVQGCLWPNRRAEARALGAQLPAVLFERAVPRLEKLLHGAEAPTHRLDAPTLGILRSYLLEVFAGSAAEGYVEAALPGLQNAQDARGLAVVLLLACGAAAQREGAA